jgi:replicative DNA helicase
MAKELKVPVIVLSQLSRAPEQRDKEGKPKLSDLRDSGAIEQDADVVMMLRRPSYYPGSEGSEDERLSVVDVCKQRNGPTGEILLNFDRDYTRFSDRVESEYHGQGDDEETEVLT